MSFGANSAQPINYLLIASGPTRRAPYLAGWQEFKDFIRLHVKGQPSWTNVLTGTRRGEVEGWTTMKDSDDADAVYNACCSSKGVLVHVFATSTQSSFYSLIKCNCPTWFPEVGIRGHSPRRSAMDNIRINEVIAKGYAMPSVHQPLSTFQQESYYPSPAYTAPPANYYQPMPMYDAMPYPQMAPYQYAVPPVPAYSQSSGGLPVNLSQGAVLTESRGIFIQGLSYSAGTSEVTSLIHGVGLRPIKVKVPKKSDGASKGWAEVEFNTKADAQYGVTHLHGKVHMGKTLTVRLDKEGTVMGPIPDSTYRPLVVDGTSIRRYN